MARLDFGVRRSGTNEQTVATSDDAQGRPRAETHCTTGVFLMTPVCPTANQSRFLVLVALPKIVPKIV
eukprot:g65663.t1